MQESEKKCADGGSGHGLSEAPLMVPVRSGLLRAIRQELVKYAIALAHSEEHREASNVWALATEISDLQSHEQLARYTRNRFDRIGGPGVIIG